MSKSLEDAQKELVQMQCDQMRDNALVVFQNEIIALKEENSALRLENEKLKETAFKSDGEFAREIQKEAAFLTKKGAEWNEEIVTLREQLKSAREVIEFYANKEGLHSKHCREWKETIQLKPTDAVLNCFGTKARDWLAQNPIEREEIQD